MSKTPLTRSAGRLWIRLTIICVFITSCMLANMPGTARPKTSLCSALRTIGPGERRSILVAGRYVTGVEMSELFDIHCRGDFQRATWVEIGSSVRGYPRLARALNGHTEADVVLRGELLGPRVVGVDWEHFSVPLPRSAGRYGHDNNFRTQLVVSEVVEARSAHGIAPKPAIWRADDGSPVSAEVPAYPTTARRFDISGEVSVAVVVRDGAVVAAVPSSNGPLAMAAASNVRTWRFARGTDRAFRTIFEYVIDQNMENSDVHLELNLPARVKVVAGPDRW